MTRLAAKKMPTERIESKSERAARIKAAIRAAALAEFREKGGPGVADHPDHIAARIEREHYIVKERFIAAGKPVPSWVLA